MSKQGAFCLLLLLTLSSVASAQGTVDKIINGEDAVPGDWPWMASLQKADGHFCGGTLIDPYWVMTAAHCVDNPRLGFPTLGSGDFHVAVGLHQRSKPEDAENIDVAEVFQHPDWDRFDFNSTYDIALIRLQTPSTKTPIPPLMPTDLQPQPGQPAIALGWGQTEVNLFRFSDVLQTVTLPVVDHTICQQTYLGEFDIGDTHLCAGFVEGGRDTCTGDSGGPLMQFDGKHWRQIGITSFGGHLNGPSCAGEEAYGVYASTSAFADFIANTLNAELTFEGIKEFYSPGEPLLVEVVETSSKVRGNVDLWLGLAVGCDFLFVSGTAQLPLFNVEPTPWQTGLTDVETRQQVFNLTLPPSLAGEFTLFAVYVRSGDPGDFSLIASAIRSNVAVSKFEIH